MIRKEYGGLSPIRYLRCPHCREEFSERKNAALWNGKIPKTKAVSVAEHLDEGTNFNGTARLVRVNPGTVRRLNERVGQHGQQYHEEKAQNLLIN